MTGNASFSRMSFLVRPRHFMTGSTLFVRPYVFAIPESTHALDTNATHVFPGLVAAHIGRIMTGSGVGMDALGSPICAYAIWPPFRTISGLLPNHAGFHSTRSASLPGSTLPTRWLMPCATAGLMVYLAMYRFTRKLSPFSEESSGSAPRCAFILAAVCHVRVTTSPTRPIACESEDMIEMAPMSCRMSSAAMVSFRMRDSANATSSGMAGSRWWHTISISRCSETVFFVYGLVGFVDEGNTSFSPQILMISGAWPPPAPSLWYVWIVRPLNASTDFSTQHDSLSVSVWIVTATSFVSATVRHASIAAGVVPQSSCSFMPTAPASMMSCKPSGFAVLPLPVNAKFSGIASEDCSIMRTCAGDGVHVVAHEPDAGPVPPPSRVVRPAAIASTPICGQMKWMCVSSPPAVRIEPSPAMASVLTPTIRPGVTPSITSGFPAFPTPTIMPSLIPTSAFKMPV
mmetsp:Transcript_5078/g.20381  ORF Transcript_5078/g.20381 Transcript_5078/m.20381 type:complete len:458 (+) Transcript_5078:528-1901(+)